MTEYIPNQIKAKKVGDKEEKERCPTWLSRHMGLSSLRVLPVACLLWILALNLSLCDLG